MGSQVSIFLAPWLWKEDEPQAIMPTRYHPEFGFPNGRKRLALMAPQVEMDSAGLEPEQRDECSHIRLQYKGCLDSRDVTWWMCNGIWDELSSCYLNDKIIDMMEFERERRLNRRERRLREKKKSEE